MNRPTFEKTVKVTETQQRIDFNKAETVDDIKAVLCHLQIVVWDDGSGKFADIRHLYADD